MATRRRLPGDGPTPTSISARSRRSCWSNGCPDRTGPCATATGPSRSLLARRRGRCHPWEHGTNQRPLPDGGLVRGAPARWCALMGDDVGGLAAGMLGRLGQVEESQTLLTAIERQLETQSEQHIHPVFEQRDPSASTGPHYGARPQRGTGRPRLPQKRASRTPPTPQPHRPRQSSPSGSCSLPSSDAANPSWRVRRGSDRTGMSAMHWPIASPLRPTMGGGAQASEQERVRIADPPRQTGQVLTGRPAMVHRVDDRAQGGGDRYDRARQPLNGHGECRAARRGRCWPHPRTPTTPHRAASRSVVPHEPQLRRGRRATASPRPLGWSGGHAPRGHGAALHPARGQQRLPDARGEWAWTAATAPRWWVFETSDLASVSQCCTHSLGSA